MLALNTAIEVARVGVAGKGFAVVASEVLASVQELSHQSENLSAEVQRFLATVRAA